MAECTFKPNVVESGKMGEMLLEMRDTMELYEDLKRKRLNAANNNNASPKDSSATPYPGRRRGNSNGYWQD